MKVTICAQHNEEMRVSRNPISVFCQACLDEYLAKKFQREEELDRIREQQAEDEW